MLTYLRYSLATFCFAASVGCLALSWRSFTHRDIVILQSSFLGNQVNLVFNCGQMRVQARYPADTMPSIRHLAVKPTDGEWFRQFVTRFGYFGIGVDDSVFFPLWYPALIFALAGVATLRLGRRFTLRSAIIATTVVAGLLGMAVGL
jgi:hypothetical protein